MALPPLRERTDDMMPLAVALFMQAVRRESRLSARIHSSEAAANVLEGIKDVLCGYAWPGNVRELQNVIERIVVELADDETFNGNDAQLDVETMRTIAPELFVGVANGNDDRMDAKTLRERSRHVEVDQIRAALAACNGDRDAACRALGISKTTLWRKLNAVR